MGDDDEENTQISTFCANVKDGKPLKRLSTQRLKTIKKKIDVVATQKEIEVP